MTMEKRLADIFFKRAKIKNYGKGTIVCNSWEEFDEAIKDINCGLVSPGGTGLPRSYLQELEKQGLIRVLRVIVDSEERPPVMLGFLYSLKDEYVYIPVDDIEKVKQRLS